MLDPRTLPPLIRPCAAVESRHSFIELECGGNWVDSGAASVIGFRNTIHTLSANAHRMKIGKIETDANTAVAED